MLDPVAAAVAALVAHLQAALSGKVPADRIRTGWPTAPRLDLDVGPVLSAYPIGEPQWMSIPPELVGTAKLSDKTMDCTYRVAEGSVTFQVLLLTAYQAQREELASSVLEALDNLFPVSSGLVLTTSYRDRPARLQVRSFKTVDSADEPDVSEWRATWTLATWLDQVRVRNVPIQSGGAIPVLTVQ